MWLSKTLTNWKAWSPWSHRSITTSTTSILPCSTQSISSSNCLSPRSSYTSTISPSEIKSIEPTLRRLLCFSPAKSTTKSYLLSSSLSSILIHKTIFPFIDCSVSAISAKKCCPKVIVKWKALSTSSDKWSVVEVSPTCQTFLKLTPSLSNNYSVSFKMCKANYPFTIAWNWRRLKGRWCGFHNFYRSSKAEEGSSRR